MDEPKTQPSRIPGPAAEDGAPGTAAATPLPRTVASRSHRPPRPRPRGVFPARGAVLGATLGAILAIVAGACGAAPAGSATGAPPSAAPIALPSDAPAVLRALAPVASCGHETLTPEGEEDASGASSGEAAGAGSSDADAGSSGAAGGSAEPSDAVDAGESDGGAACLIHAFDQRLQAEFATDTHAESGDEQFTLYRVAGDGTLVLYVRNWSAYDRRVTWSRLVCHDVSVTDEGITPDGCGSPEVIH